MQRVREHCLIFSKIVAEEYSTKWTIREGNTRFYNSFLLGASYRKSPSSLETFLNFRRLKHCDSNTIPKSCCVIKDRKDRKGQTYAPPSSLHVKLNIYIYIYIYAERIRAFRELSISRYVKNFLLILMMLKYIAKNIVLNNFFLYT